MQVKPFNIKLDERGVPETFENKVTRRLSDMKGFFSQSELQSTMLSKGEDPLIYEVYEIPQPPEEGNISLGTTIIYPGKIGDEYFFTKGHYHQREPSPEIYLGIKGEGLLLLQSRGGEVKTLSLKPGEVDYIPPNWAHRTVNVGKEELTFLSIYPSIAGHDYGSIEQMGFAKLVLEKNGRPVVVDNPRFKR